MYHAVILFYYTFHTTYTIFTLSMKYVLKNMAAVVATADMTIQKNSQILVNVEEALEDLLVVTYSTEDKKFQGVLLDSNKGFVFICCIKYYY